MGKFVEKADLIKRATLCKKFILKKDDAGSEITGFPGFRDTQKKVVETQKLGLGFRLETLGKWYEPLKDVVLKKYPL